MAEFSTTRITPGDNVQFPAVNGQVTGYVQGSDMATKAQLDDAVTSLMGRFDAGRSRFDAASTGIQTKAITFNKTFKHPPIVIVCWSENNAEQIQSYFSSLQVIQSTVTTTGFSAGGNRISTGGSWFFSWFAYDPN